MRKEVRRIKIENKVSRDTLVLIFALFAIFLLAFIGKYISGKSITQFDETPLKENLQSPPNEIIEKGSQQKFIPQSNLLKLSDTLENSLFVSDGKNLIYKGIDYGSSFYPNSEKMLNDDGIMWKKLSECNQKDTKRKLFSLKPISK